MTTNPRTPSTPRTVAVPTRSQPPQLTQQRTGQGPRRRPAATAELLAALAGRLTTRDRWILTMLAEHRVLTTTQIAALAFPNPRNTERRLAALWQWRCIERFRPHTRFGGGSAPWHWVLDDAGTAILAAAHGITVPELGYRPGTALAIAHSQRLAHTIGTNTLLADLARTGQLSDWWGERRCAAAWGDLARPDAAATWHTPTGHPGGPPVSGSSLGGPTAGARAVGFAVEYDTGTEPLTRVAAKLADYADLAAAVGHTLPVLFWLPTVTRESALHHQLDTTSLDTTHLDTTSPDTTHLGTASPDTASVHAGAGPIRASRAGGGLLVATAAADHAARAGGPAGRVWRPAGPPAAGKGGRRSRVTLDQLATAWSAARTLPVAAVDVGFGWPAPSPLPPDRHHGGYGGTRPWES